ncbi:MAG: hypothetical protein VXY23_03775 [Pseudomonadota bacterium]|nr:hypothetical protein [Pseudomonadota bacterium]
MANGAGSAALVILLVLISGYTCATYCYRFKFKYARESGYKLYFSYGFIGLIFYVLAKFLLAFVLLVESAICPGFIEFLVSTISPYLIVTRANAEFAACILLAVAYTFLYNGTLDSKAKNLRRAANKNDLSRLFLYCMDNTKLVTITLETRKIYIGLVQRSDEPIDINHISILPLFSGYREKTNQALKITNDYGPVFYKLLDDSKDQVLTPMDFSVVVPVSRIVSAHIYDPVIYATMQEGSKSA